MVLDGAMDKLEAPSPDDPTADVDGDGVTNELSITLSSTEFINELRLNGSMFSSALC